MSSERLVWTWTTYVLPFTVVPENGQEIDNLDDMPELAYRTILVNVLRLLGAVKNKVSRHFAPCPM